MAWSLDWRYLATESIDETARIGTLRAAASSPCCLTTIRFAAWHGHRMGAAGDGVRRSDRADLDVESGSELAVLRGHDDWVWGGMGTE